MQTKEMIATHPDVRGQRESGADTGESATSNLTSRRAVMNQHASHRQALHEEEKTTTA
jgi:hypothetical protein